MTEQPTVHLSPATPELVRDPDWLHARIKQILTCAEEFADKYPDEDRSRNLGIAYRVRLKSLATDIQLFGEVGDRVLAALVADVPDLAWRRGAQGIYSFALTDAEAEKVADRLGLDEERVDAGRMWGGNLTGYEEAFEIRVYGPYQESDQ